MDYIAWIREGLDKPGKTQTGLAKALGRYPSAITQLLKGSRTLKADEIRIVARYLESEPPADMSSEDVAAALPDPIRPRAVKLKGYVGAGSEMHYYRLADEEYEEVPAPPNATNQTVAVEIRGTSMGDQFPGWLVYYTDVHSPVSEALHGRLCVVGLADDRILIKRIKPQKNGLYSLLSNGNEPPIQDVSIEWAALVTALMPRE